MMEESVTRRQGISPRDCALSVLVWPVLVLLQPTVRISDLAFAGIYLPRHPWHQIRHPLRRCCDV
jgi:hypothetical protein